VLLHLSARRAATVSLICVTAMVMASFSWLSLFLMDSNAESLSHCVAFVLPMLLEELAA